MAEEDISKDTRSARLQVAPARQEESGQGIARVPRSVFQQLGITEGDVVEIEGTLGVKILTLGKEPDA